jgi:hypothetical protein
MIGKLKTLGLAVLAIAAISAFAVPAAQAGELDIGLQPASLFAQIEAGQAHTFVLQQTNSQNEFPTRCTTATLEGTTVGLKINEATFTPTYSNCTDFGVASQALMNGCKYTLTGAGQPANTFLFDIVGCTIGKQMEKKTAICNLHVPEQTGLAHIVANNINAQQVTLSMTVTGIKVQQTGAACPDGNLHTGTNVRFTGSTLLVARKDEGAILVTKHNHQYEELKQNGVQTTIQST